MPEWAKILTLIVGLVGWLATVAATLLRNELPDATMLGIPAALILALAPPISIGRGRGRTTGRRATPADDGEAEAADGPA